MSCSGESPPLHLFHKSYEQYFRFSTRKNPLLAIADLFTVNDHNKKQILMADSDEKASYQDLHHCQLLKHQ